MGPRSTDIFVNKYVKKMIEEIHGTIVEKKYLGWDNSIHPDGEILDKMLRSTGLDTVVSNC